MVRIEFRFYDELNDFLSRDLRKKTFHRELRFQTSVKDAIESQGVPHTEADLILANSESVDFHYKINDRDRISVFPIFKRIDVSSASKVHQKPLTISKFVLDVHLGRLASFLRIAGYDTLYQKDISDQELAYIAARGNRILLTRDRELLKRSMVLRGYFVRGDCGRTQFAEIYNRFNLRDGFTPFIRCPKCNGVLHQIDKAILNGRAPEMVLKRRVDFQECTLCRKIYWKGSHQQKLAVWFNSLDQQKQ